MQGLPLLALALADLALARTAGWTAPVPLALLAVSWAEARAAGRDPAAWLSLCSRCLAGAGVLALTLFSTVHAAAERLLAVAPSVRIRGIAPALTVLLEEEAVIPRQLQPALSDRAGRRLVDQLTAQGALRELTGRAAFRIYGL
ncbi:DUF1403 family protein [Beijerinckia mobilis]|uniref:DUF1403 family protein n=1 Tax=Beijerinckia mobilis TaxID=231434 RepID=UPI00068A97BE|nr:DUF1403 family protein [Beijerinckia mobilis]